MPKFTENRDQGGGGQAAYLARTLGEGKTGTQRELVGYKKTRKKNSQKGTSKAF